MNRSRLHVAHRVLLVALLGVLLIVPMPAAAAPADVGEELGIVKQAYDILLKQLYTNPDTVALLTEAYKEAQTAYGAQTPLAAKLTGSPQEQWSVFERSVRALAAGSDASLESGDLRARLIRSFAKTVNDPHTAYLSKRIADQQRAEDMGDTSITNYGLRALMTGDDVYVAAIVPGGNMEAAGARAGDHILSLDNQAVNAKNYRALFAPPKEGDTHQIVVVHPGETAPVALVVTIKKYAQVGLTYRVLDGHIGYIQTYQFYRDMPERFDEALAALHAQNVDSLIIDLRDDPGGFATAERRVTGRFIPNGTVYGSNTGRNFGKRSSIASSDDQPLETLPIVAVVNDGSASASEYLALALRDFRQTPLVGAMTPGVLGTAQVYDLKDGSGIEVTIGVYTTAKGEALNNVGITPDVEVADPTSQEVVAGVDKQLYAAIAVVNGKVGRSETPALPLAA